MLHVFVREFEIPSLTLTFWNYRRRLKSRDSYIASIKLEDVATMERTRKLRKRQRLSSTPYKESQGRVKMARLVDDLDTSNTPQSQVATER